MSRAAKKRLIAAAVANLFPHYPVFLDLAGRSVVLIGADMPSVLAEIGFLTNSRDESLLKSEEHRDRLAEALYQGIQSYAESLSKAPKQVARAGK